MTSSFTPFMRGHIACVAMCVAGFPFHGYVAMGPMAVNQMTPDQMRAQVSAMYLFVVNLLGLGLGPGMVALISNYILHDESQIRVALTIVIATSGTLAAILLWLERGAFQQRSAEAAHWR